MKGLSIVRRALLVNIGDNRSVEGRGEQLTTDNSVSILYNRIDARDGFPL